MARDQSCSVYQAKERITLKEFREWGAFYEIEIENPSYDSINTALLLSLVYNYLCKSRKTIKDFLPRIRINKKESFTKEQGGSFLMRLAKMIKGVNKK